MSVVGHKSWCQSFFHRPRAAVTANCSCLVCSHQCRCLTRDIDDHLVIHAACLNHVVYDLCMFCSLMLVMRAVYFSATELIMGLLPCGCTRPCCSSSCVAVDVMAFLV